MGYRKIERLLDVIYFFSDLFLRFRFFFLELLGVFEKNRYNIYKYGILDFIKLVY